MFQNLPDILTVEDMQKALCIGRSQAYKLINGGGIPHMRVGRSIKIPKKFLVDYIEKQCYHNRAVDDSPVNFGREAT